MADEVSSIANIRRLANAIKKPPLSQWNGTPEVEYERARADFWRAVAEWRYDHPRECRSAEIEQLCAIVRERESA